MLRLSRLDTILLPWFLAHQALDALRYSGLLSQRKILRVPLHSMI